MTTIDRLNELLEELLNLGAGGLGEKPRERLDPRPFRFEGVRNDEAWACAGLSDSSTAVRGGSSNGWMLSSVTRSLSL
jgi:hypothetical protein